MINIGMKIPEFTLSSSSYIFYILESSVMISALLKMSFLLGFVFLSMTVDVHFYAGPTFFINWLFYKN